MKALVGAFNPEKGPYSMIVKTNCEIDGLFYSFSLNLRVQPGCRVLNLLDQAGHVLEEEVVKVLLLHVLELEHGLAGGLGGHGDGVADCGGLAVLCYGGRDRLPDTDTGHCPGTIRADPRR